MSDLDATVPPTVAPSATSRSRRLGRRAAWGVPVVVAAAVAGVAVLPNSASADAHPQLPALTAAQLLVAVQGSSTQALSGTVVETARLGLPSLPGVDSSASLDWQSLVLGSHTARVWVDGPERQRLALVGQLAESDIVHNGRDVWTYTSNNQAVTHAVLPAEQADRPEAAAPAAGTLTPAAAAEKALAAVDPTTVVTVDRTQRVAGRPAYTLVLAPKDNRSTVRRVEVALDSETHVPLSVQVFGSADQAAFETGFTDVSFATPAASVFRFTPPAGSTVTTHELTAPAKDATGPAPVPATQPTVVGTGWTSILVVPASAGAGSAAAGNPLLDRLTTTRPNGDRLVSTSLLSVLLKKDGRVLVGAVSPGMLEQAAG